MADTQRTRSAILTLFADNVTGQISPQDLRDFVVTVMESEFVNAGDFWNEPKPDYISIDKSGKGQIDYSQIAGSTLSFMDAVYLASNGMWLAADIADSTKVFPLGIALDSYASNLSTCQILRKGMLYDSALSARFSDAVGNPVYLQSGAAGEFSVDITTNSTLILGYVTPASAGSAQSSGKWFFNPEWAIKG